MKLVFEKGAPGRGLSLLPANDVPEYKPSETREKELRLPEISEVELVRHYSELASQCFSVGKGMYPLGSCTMKYNPQVNEQMASLPGFTGIHPLQPEHTIEGCREAEDTLRKYICEYTGMDAVTLQPAAGAHGEFTGLLTIRKYHEKNGELDKRTKIIVPDSAHGTNPASAVMAGFTIVNIPSTEEGLVDLEALKAAAGEDTAGLMLTNPNTLGLFDRNIKEITDIVHEAGGLCYYDGANLNAVLGVARPGDMGFDVVHLNLHKTFSAPHGGGGPGSGPVGCKAFLEDCLPKHVKEFYGNFLVEIKALTYMLTIGGNEAKAVANNAVLNARYMMNRLADIYDMVSRKCMHEFVITAEKLKKRTGVTAMDVAKSMIDNNMYAPTMYFPLIVHEALMVEPTETEPKEKLDEAVEVMRGIFEKALEDPEYLHNAPHNTVIGRPDETMAARKPVLRYQF